MATFCRRRASTQGWVTCFVNFMEAALLPVLVLGQGASELNVCEWETFHARCPSNHVIVITSAIYGRMRVGACVQQDMGHIGCFTNVKHVLDAKCSGRRECSFRIPDPELDKEKPCLELKSYLQASYDCRKVESLEGARCKQCDYVRVQNEVGYLASAVTSETGCGSMDCPWFISGGEGQRIRVSLVDFSPADHSSIDSCNVYAVIKEKANLKSSTICEGRGRRDEHQVYLSHGPELEIRILGNTQTDKEMDYFLLKYEVYGCTVLTIEGATIEQDDSLAEVACDHVDRIWTLRCNGTHWTGQNFNCSAHSLLEEAGSYSGEPVFNTTSLIIMAVVAIIICSLVVVIGIVCFKICTHTDRQRRTPRTYDEPPDICHPPTLTRDSYCVTHLPHMTTDGTLTLDRCSHPPKLVTCKTYSFDTGPKNDYEHICDSSNMSTHGNAVRAEFAT